MRCVPAKVLSTVATQSYLKFYYMVIDHVTKLFLCHIYDYYSCQQALNLIRSMKSIDRKANNLIMMVNIHSKFNHPISTNILYSNSRDVMAEAVSMYGRQAMVDLTMIVTVMVTPPLCGRYLSTQSLMTGRQRDTTNPAALPSPLLSATENLDTQTRVW